MAASNPLRGSCRVIDNPHFNLTPKFKLLYHCSKKDEKFTSKIKNKRTNQDRV